MDITSPEQPKQIENLKPNNEIDSGIQRNGESPEPPLAPGMTRLYRAEYKPKLSLEDFNPGQPLPPAFLENRGRWFTNSREAAEWYLKNNLEEEPRKLFYVDIPTNEASQWKISNLPKDHLARHLSMDTNTEFVLPREIAEQKKSIPSSTYPLKYPEFYRKK